MSSGLLRIVGRCFIMAISKKLRFDIFKRDGFKCQYCGSVPPIVVLEVDHIIPVSKKGTDEVDNLITSCFDCNRGKSNRELSMMPQTTIEKTEQLKEKEEQYQEYRKILAKIKKREMAEIDSIDEIYSSYFPEWCLNDRFKNGSLRTFLKILGFVRVEQAMHTACTRMYDDSKAIKYFCGICWNRIKDPENA